MLFLSTVSFINIHGIGVSNAETKIKVGISTALSGDAATYGLDVVNAIKFANDKLGEGKYELIIEDDKCEPKTSALIAQKFSTIDRVDFVIGYACSGAMLAAAPILERAKIPTIVTCASADTIADAGDYVFRTFPSDRGVAITIGNRIISKENSLGIISDQTEYAQGIKNNLLDAIKGSALKIVTEDQTPGSLDYRSLIVKLRSAGVGSIFLNSQTEAGGVAMIKQTRELGWNAPIYSVYWPSSPSFLELAGSLANGIEFADSPTLDNLLLHENLSMIPVYVQKYGNMRSIEAVFASSYEAFRIMHESLKSGEDVRSYISKTKFDGIFGKYSFDSRGEIDGFGFVLKKIVEGKPELITQ